MNKEQIRQLEILMEMYKSVQGGIKETFATAILAYLDGCLSGIITPPQEITKE